MASKETKISLPGAVLTSFVFPFVGVKTLKKAACVCKEWRKAVDEDVVWKNQCVILWRGKKNVPQITKNDREEDEPQHLYPYAIYGPDLKLSIKEMRPILENRDVHMERFIEKSEFQRALELTQPKSISRWGFTYSSKWKASYVYSAVRAREDRITRHELISTVWRMEFKYNGMTCESRFLGDGTYWSTLGDFNRGGTLTWVLIPNSDGRTFDYTGVRVAEYPSLEAKRTEDWGLELHNDYVVFRQMGSTKDYKVH